MEKWYSCNGMTVSAKVMMVMVWCLLTIPFSVQAQSDADEGYFLSWKQKGQLIWYGEISDNSGNRYDILD